MAVSSRNLIEIQSQHDQNPNTLQIHVGGLIKNW